MSLFTDVRAALTGSAPVMAIANQVYRGIPSQEAPVPFIAIHVVGDTVQNHLEGEDDLQNIVLQVDCWASDVDTAYSLYGLAKAALAACTVKMVRTAYREIYDGDTKLWRASSDWSTWSNG